MRKFKSILLVVLMAVFCVAQSANEYEAPGVTHIAGMLNCSCGCHLNMACVMPPSGVCGMCRDNKIRIAKMMASGMSEKQILDQYVAEQGKTVLVVSPGIGGFAGPYIALGLGLGAVLLVIRRYKGLKPAPAVVPADDAELARYHDQIEKDLEKLG
ncbi:MAG: cytochrome c-type biogenesis protein CcmH [Acidobacteriota bacterium]